MVLYSLLDSIPGERTILPFLTVTEKRIKLCAVHLAPDSAPPLPDPVLDFPAVNLSDSATEDLLQGTGAEDNSLELMGSAIDT